jgi:hypothetical protein
MHTGGLGGVGKLLDDQRVVGAYKRPRNTYTSAYVSIRQNTSAYVSIRQHTSAYVSIRQHTSAYVSIHQHTAAYVSEQLDDAGVMRT